MEIAARVLLVGFLLAASATHAAEVAPAEQLQRMSRALRQLDYQGSFLYQTGSRLDTLRLYHAAGGVERERLLSLSGSRNEVLRVGEAITFLKADSAAFQYSVGATARLLPLIPDALQALPASAYSLRSGTSDRVAGYDAAVVDIVPLDRFRYGYRVWLERATQLPLRVALIGAEQRLVEQMMFVTLSIGNAPSAADLALSDAPERIVAAVEEAPISGDPRWIVDALPPGFALTSRRGNAATTQTGAEHLIFSDGLASVSVYIEPTGDPVEDDIAMNRGAMNVYVHRVAGWRHTALGNVPTATVQQFATALRPAVSGAPAH